jgi:hypothetical protein
LALAILVSFYGGAASAAPPNGWREFPAYAVNVSASRSVSVPDGVCPVSAVSDVDARSRRTGRRVERVTIRERVIRNRAPFAVRVYVFCG